MKDCYLLFLTVIVLGMFTLLLSIAHAVYCSDCRSYCSVLCADASITGTSPLSSSGWAMVQSDVKYSGICCIYLSFISGILGSEYEVERFAGGLGRTFSESFYSAGRYVYASVNLNLCDGLFISIGASLDGSCFLERCL